MSIGLVLLLAIVGLFCWVAYKRHVFRTKYGAKMDSCRLCSGEGCHWYTNDEMTEGKFKGMKYSLNPRTTGMAACHASFVAACNNVNK